MTTMKKKACLYIAAALLVASCGTKNEQEEGRSEDLPEKNTVELTDKQMQQLNITTGALADHTFAGTIQASGRLTTSPQGEASIAPKMGANVERVLVREGQEVTKGQVLAYLSHPDLLEIQSRYLTAVNRRDYLSKEYQRQTQMMDEKVGAGKDYDRTKSELQIINSEIRMLTTQLQQLGIAPSSLRAGKAVSAIAVTSPIAGTVERIDVETGQYAAPETPMMRIINTQSLFAELQVYQSDLPRLQKGQEVDLQVQAAGDGGKVFKGKIYAIGKTFDSNMQSVPVRVDMDGAKDALISGLYVEAQIAAGVSTMKAVPAEAVVDEEDKLYIFAAVRVGDKWTFTPIAVTKIKEENGMVAVKPVQEDLKMEGRTVALSGAYYLLSEMKKGETGEE